MRNYFCFLLLVCSGISFAQENEKPKKRPKLEFKVNARFQLIQPIQFGNTALAKAHSPYLGISSQLNLLDFMGFKAGFGVDMVGYKITDKQMIANLHASKYTSAYVLLSYEYKLSEKFLITPNIGWGSASLELGSRSSRFGGQDGNEIRIGGILDYKIGKSTYVFGGINYINTTLDVQTAPEYKSYFSNANQIQLSLGIRFGN